jgi:hypothetical protein
MGTVPHLRTINQTTEPRSRTILYGKVEQLVRFPWAADSCPWVGKIRTVLPFTDRDVIRDSAVQLGRHGVLCGAPPRARTRSGFWAPARTARGTPRAARCCCGTRRG